MKRNKRDKNGFIQLEPIPGSEADKYIKSASRKKKISKDPDKFLDKMVEEHGADNVIRMTEVNIGDYVYEKGIIHALNMNVGRNIPWIEDGLKSVERRVLYVMHESKLYGGHADKVAGVTGDMIKMVYPHGDAAAAETIYRMGRKYSTMIPYIEAGGNYGNMYDLRPAAPRYAEASLSNYAVDCFFSEMGPLAPLYDEKDNYKYSAKEPIFLTSRYPNILMQWNLGIGKGAAAWLGAFNSKDIFKAAITLLDDPNAKINIYPDCPIPVNIINKSELKDCFDKANFKVRLEAPYEVELDKRKGATGKVEDKHTIVFTALPISTTGQSIRNEIIAIKEKDMKRPDKKLPEVLNVEVDTVNTLGGIRFIVEYEKGYDSHILAQKLYRSTSLGKTIAVKYNLINANRPRSYTPRQILLAWIEQRYDQKRRYYHQMALVAAKDKAKYEAISTILDAKNIDIAIKLIRAAKNDEASIKALKDKFGFTEFQAKMVIAIRLGTLSKMNRDDIIHKRDEAIKSYKHYRKLLTHEGDIKAAIREELEEGLKKYGMERRAKLMDTKVSLGDPSQKKILVYNSDEYYCLSSYDELTLIAKKIDKSYNIITIQNSDNLVLFNRKGMLKILDGYSFSLSTQAISFGNIAFTSVIRILPTTLIDCNEVALVTKNGYAKVMEYSECVKSVKGKVINLNTGDELADIVPVNREDDSGILGLISGDTLYYVKIGNVPLLKRASAGNRMISRIPNLNVTSAVYGNAETKFLMIYGESGYIKIMDTAFMSFAKRGNNSISLQGKTIYDVVHIMDSSQTLKLYDNTGTTGITVEIDKMIKFKLDSGETQKFKMSTSIGNPVKVFKKGKNEFYKIRNHE